MKALHILPRSVAATIVDFQTNSAKQLDNARDNVSCIWIAPEDMQVVYNREDGTQYVTQAKKGDIIVKFYNQTDIPNPIVVVKNNKWKENYEWSKAEEEKRQIEFSFKRNCTACESCNSDC